MVVFELKHQKAFSCCDITVKNSLGSNEHVYFYSWGVFCVMKRLNMFWCDGGCDVWVCRRTVREEGVQQNVMRGGGSSCESKWRIYFFCVGRLRDTSVLWAEGRPDNLDTTSTTNCYSITEHRLTAAIQRYSPPQLHLHSAASKLEQSSAVRTPEHGSVSIKTEVTKMYFLMGLILKSERKECPYVWK